MPLELIKKEIRSIDTSTLVDKVESSLVELLKARKLSVGDVIPKEMELAETLGVSPHPSSHYGADRIKEKKRLRNHQPRFVWHAE